MEKILNKLVYSLLIILFFSLPLINSHLLDLFGFDFPIYVEGNYEFTKVIYFNIFSGLILFLFGIKSLLDIEKIIIPRYTLFIGLFLIISTILSTSFYTSLFGNTEKGHSLIMFLNLIGIFIILINSEKKILKKLILTSILSAVFISIIGIWQLYFPSFDYGQLSNRLVSTFGHPNYISLYFLLILPFLFSKKIISSFFPNPSPFGDLPGKGKNIFIAIILISLVLTKSFIAIFLAFSYLYFGVLKKFKFKKHLYSLIIFIGFISIILFTPEKLSSLISRFFIWETTIRIIFSNIEIILIGGGAETFIYFFDNFKSEYLYIFEKIGFTADRPHNIILNFFYHFGILGFIFIISLYYKIFKNFIIKQSSINISLFLASIFLLFNFASIASYLLIILLLSFKKYNTLKVNQNIFCLFLIFLSLFSIYFSSKLYISETYAYEDNYSAAINIFPYNPYNYYKIGEYNPGLKIEKIDSEKYYLTKIYSLDNPITNCESLVSKYYSVENYLFCGNFLWKIGKYQTAKSFYNIGLEKLPDLWNKDSKYYNNIFIKNFISGNRFFSNKYSNINQILKRVGKNK